MNLRIALAGNPNSGKTTLFNALTGSNQFVGNWPGVTVEKKEGKLKGHPDVTVTDLPGIYSLSPYTLEEVVARNYLINERPDAILNIVDGTNLERNLYLTTQLKELGIPMVIAVNMVDIIAKRGDKINVKELSKALDCKIVEISALKGHGITEAASLAIEAAKNKQEPCRVTFSNSVEHILSLIKEEILSDIPEKNRDWYAIKLFERDEKVLSELNIPDFSAERLEELIQSIENEADDDSESIITNERYSYISSLMQKHYHKKDTSKLSVSDKIDRVVTNRFAALPIFAVIMILVYYISVSTVGTWVTDWTNDGLFGDGFHLFGIGSGDYETATDNYIQENLWTDDFISAIETAKKSGITGTQDISDAIANGDTGAFIEAFDTYSDALSNAGYSDITDKYEAVTENAPAPSDYGIYVPGIPVLAEKGLDAVNSADWLKGLIVDGIIGGVGAVLGFVPQMLVLFLFLAFLEACGYMARIAFVMDRIFRKFGLSGKSFIPMLIGTGCGVPGIMASRTIENDRDRKMTIMTTTFIPCGAKLPIIALISTALFGGAWWVAPSAYFIGMAAIVVSGIMLKKTRLFAGDPAPFVMELPAYHMPTASNILRSMWERSSSFIKKAGTIILLASVIIWATSCLGFVDGKFAFSSEMALESSLLGIAGNAISVIFKPLGFGNIKASIATIMGLVAKEEVVGVFGVLDFEGLTQLAAYSFLIFNLLCAPCFAAIGAIRREMNSAKWTWFAIGYQCVFAYVISLMVYQFGRLFTGTANIIGVIVAAIFALLIIYLLLRPATKKIKSSANANINA